MFGTLCLITISEVSRNILHKTVSICFTFSYKKVAFILPYNYIFCLSFFVMLWDRCLRDTKSLSFYGGNFKGSNFADIKWTLTIRHNRRGQFWSALSPGLGWFYDRLSTEFVLRPFSASCFGIKGDIVRNLFPRDRGFHSIGIRGSAFQTLKLRSIFSLRFTVLVPYWTCLTTVWCHTL